VKSYLPIRIRDVNSDIGFLTCRLVVSFSSQLTYKNVRHIGRCIYGGIYDPGNPLSDAHGYRTDVISALRQLDIPVIRYPGGNFVATYHWQDGVGPKENRPARPELAWLGTETNEFGTLFLNHILKFSWIRY
jgi:alpha-L-arabinofuranosidase